MKNIKIFFIFTLYALTVACEGNGAEKFDVDFDNPMFSKLDDDGRNIIKEYAKAYSKIMDF